jgi:octaprenyl-diphosphate synthase
MSPSSVKSGDITGPIREELRRLEQELRGHFSSKLELVTAIGDHLMNTRGKRVRPILVLLSAKLGRPDTADALRVAAAIEIIHTATLLHDDSIDRSGLRRGLPTVNRLWNDQVSVIMGDHLFCSAFRLLHEAGLFDIASVISEGSDRLTYGEMYQMDLRGKYDVSEEAYLDMVKHKTAALFRTACETGAMLGRLREAERLCLRAFGECVGIAFQIIDDILDFVGDVELTGKPVGNDLRDGRVTLPLLAAMRNAGEGPAARLRQLLPPADLAAREWKEIVAFIEEHGGIAYSREKAERLAARAKDHIAGLEECPAKASLMALADRAVLREK